MLPRGRPMDRSVPERTSGAPQARRFRGAQANRPGAAQGKASPPPARRGRPPPRRQHARRGGPPAPPPPRLRRARNSRSSCGRRARRPAATGLLPPQSIDWPPPLPPPPPPPPAVTRAVGSPRPPSLPACLPIKRLVLQEGLPVMGSTAAVVVAAASMKPGTLAVRVGGLTWPTPARTPRTWPAAAGLGGSYPRAAQRPAGQHRVTLLPG